MPTFGASGEYVVEPTRRTDYGNPTPEEINRSVNAGRQRIRGPITTLGAAVVGAVPDLVDTIGSSVGLIERGSLNESIIDSISPMLTSIGLPGLRNLYNDTRGATEVASGVLGIIGTELLARRITAPGSLLMNVASKTPYARRLAALDAQYASALQTVRAVDLQLARNGALGIEQFVGSAVVGGATVTRNQAVRSARLFGAGVAARNAAVTETLMYPLLNENSMLYDDSAAWNMFWMSAGVAVPAGVEWLFTGYRFRKAAGEAELLRSQIGALDPLGTEETRLIGRSNIQTSETILPGLGGSRTDEVTSLLIEGQGLRSSPTPAGVDGVQLAANRDRLRVQKMAMARELLAGVSNRGISTDGRSRFTVGIARDARRAAGSIGYSNHIDEAMRRDPSVFYLVEQMGAVPEELPASVFAERHMTRLQEYAKEIEERILNPETPKIELERLKLRRLQLTEEMKQTPMVLIDGERMPLSEAATIEGYTPPNPENFEFIASDIRSGSGPAAGPIGVWMIRRPSMESTVASLDNNLDLVLHTGRELNELDHYDYLRLYALGNKVTDALAKSGESIVLPSKPNWFQLDMAEEILRRSDGSAKVIFPAGMTRESAQVESFAQKAEALSNSKMMRAMEGVVPTPGKRQLDREELMAQLRVRLNLPKTTAYEMGVRGSADSPELSLLRGAANYGPDEIRKMSLTELKQAVATWQRLGDLAPVTARDVESLTGNSFTFMTDSNGQPLKPIMMMLRPAKPFEWVADNVAERIAMRQTIQSNILLDPEKADEFTRLLAMSLHDSPDAIRAAATHELRETQMMGSLTSSAPSSLRGAVANALTTSEFVARDAPVILSAGRVRDFMDRLAGNYVTKLFSETFGGTLNQLANPRNTQTVTLLDQFHSMARGWDLKDKVVSTSDGFYAFALQRTPANLSRWTRQFGTTMPEGQLLISATGTTVVLDQLGLQAQRQFNNISDRLIDAKNTLLRSRGLREINRKNFYVPTPNVEGKHIGFVYGPDGKPVPGMTIIAGTQAEYARRAEELLPELEKKGLGYTLRSMDDIREYGSIWDRAIADMIDPNTTAIQPGKKSMGSLTERNTRIGSFSESVENMREQFLTHGRDVLETHYDASIKAARMRAIVSQAVRPEGRRIFSNTTNRGIHDHYIETLLGTSKVHNDKTVVGKLYNGIEGSVDQFLRAATPTASRVWQAMGAWQNRLNPFRDSDAAKKDFEALRDALGKYMPFASQADLIEARSLGAKPWTHMEVAGRLNNFTSTILLRVLDASHAVLNLGGLMASTPSVIKHFSPRADETTEQFLQRIGHVGTVFQTPSGKTIGIPNTQKIVARGLRAAFDPKNHSLYDDFVARGMLSQEIAELHKQYGLINGRSSWQRFFLGDPSISKPKGAVQNLRAKGVIGWMSVLSDKSEDFTRTVATMSGYELAKELGIVSKEARLSFAHDVANKIIANYSPANRPEIYQGALGTSIGLFQSFIQNYYQRLFRYVETKDWASFASQYIWQGTIFGLPSLPGWTALSAIRESTTEERDDLTADLRQTFGGAADLIEGGVLSNLPTLFGAPAIDWYSRGDTNPRIPGGTLFANPGASDKPAAQVVTELAPAMGVMYRIMGGINEAVEAFWNSHTYLSASQIGEILSNAMPNRPIAGMIEVFLAGGNDTDRYGQLVAETQNAMEAAYRILGVRSMRQTQDIEAFYSSRSAMTHKAGLDRMLRMQMRAAAREGRLDEMYDIFYSKYIANGGDPRYFRRALREAEEAATETRSSRQLESALNNPARAAEVNRFLDVGIGVGEDENPDLPVDLYGAMNAGNDAPLGLQDYQGQMTDPTLTQPQGY